MNINLLRVQLLIEAANILNEAGAQQKQTGMKRDQLTKINQQIDKLKRNNGSKEEISKLQANAKELQSWLDKYGTNTRSERKKQNKNIGQQIHHGEDTDEVLTKNVVGSATKKYTYQDDIEKKTPKKTNVDTNHTVIRKELNKIADMDKIKKDFNKEYIRIKNSKALTDSQKKERIEKLMNDYNKRGAILFKNSDRTWELTDIGHNRINPKTKVSAKGKNAKLIEKYDSNLLSNTNNNASMQVKDNALEQKLGIYTATDEGRLTNAASAHEMGHWDTINPYGAVNTKYSAIAKKFQNDRYGINYTDLDDEIHDERTKKIVAQLQKKMDDFIAKKKKKGQKVSSHLELSELIADSHAVGSGRSTLSAQIDRLKNNIENNKKDLKEIRYREVLGDKKYSAHEYDERKQSIEELEFRLKLLKELKDKLN